jgi:hypothetical protein
MHVISSCSNEEGQKMATIDVGGCYVAILVFTIAKEKFAVRLQLLAVPGECCYSIKCLVSISMT